MTVLITGGTVFASRYAAEYFVKKGHTVYVINRNSKPQSEGVRLIECDRHNLGDRLKGICFDLVFDVTAYNENDVSSLCRALGSFGTYIFVSSSAVYPETLPQPFNEAQDCGENKIWGAYGTDKLAAERYLRENLPQAYIIRPPYLCGRMNNLYREAFVFECAEKNRTFYIPKDGKMKMQFFDIEDMCAFAEILCRIKPEQHVFNVGNPDTVDIVEWVSVCSQAAGRTLHTEYVRNGTEQRAYFPFYDYEYLLDVSEMLRLMPKVKPFDASMHEAYEWYSKNREQIRRKNLTEYIDEHFAR